jgi:FAD/FMN-containing dehydrogenase
MEWIEPGHPQYDERRAVFNVSIDKRPAVIASCATPADVAAALDRARRDALPVAVRAGGHSVAGLSTIDGGLVVDVRPMKEVTIDPEARRARVGAGVTWGEFDVAGQEHGLAAPGGRASTTGVAGFTLGGGSSWIERKYGFACDNLVAVELVTADGRTVRADETSQRELLWAHRGGGGNFGVVTTLEFDLHPVGPMVLAGILVWPAEAADDVARAYRDWAYDAPDELGSGLVMFTAPPEEPFPEELQGRIIVGAAVVWTGDPDEGRDVVRTLRDLSPALDLVDLMPYSVFTSMLDDPPGLRHYWSADHHDDLPDAAVDLWVKYALNRPSPSTQQLLVPWGGAVARGHDTPLAHRDAHWITHPYANWERAEDDVANIAWVRDFRTDLAPYAAGGAWLNFVGAEGSARVAAAFGPENYGRLQQVKAEFDPGNLFRGNQNIEPAG